MEKCLDYVIKHNLEAVYDDIKNSDAMKVMYNFQKQGFKIDLSEIEVYKTVMGVAKATPIFLKKL